MFWFHCFIYLLQLQLAFLGRGNLKADFSLKNRRSKLAYSLEDILFDEKNDELSYFVLFMDSLGSTSYVKFLLDLNNFEKAIRKNKPCQVSLSNACIKSACKMASSSANKNNRCDCHLIQRKAIADDALSIFSKYISKDATYSVNVSDEIIHEIIGIWDFCFSLLFLNFIFLTFFYLS